ncbi:MAG: conjugal transfer protein TraF [Aquabacterium sp.]
MKKTLTFLLIAVTAQMSWAGLGDASKPVPTYQKGPEGWFWHEDRHSESEEKAKKTAVPSVATPAQDDPDTKDLAAFTKFQKQLDEAMKIATINPTDANMKRFLMLLAESRRKAAVFTMSGVRVAALTPSVDDRFNGMNMRPPSPAATRVWDANVQNERNQRIQALSQTHGIFFFFRGDCQYCHAFAPMLKRFANAHGLAIFPVSMDGGILPDFPDSRPDNGMALQVMDQLGIPREQFVVPFTVLARPKTREVIPIGFGVMNETELGERLDLFAKEAMKANDTGAYVRQPSNR